MHPYPSLLNGLLTTAIALVAGATPGSAARLGLAMLALQCSIGSLYDIVDAPHDAGRKVRKPIPTGLVEVGEARLVVAGGLVLGLLLASGSGVATLGAAILGVGAGYLYDLRLKGSALSWAPFAVGIPILPIFAWLGATGTIPGIFAMLVPLAALAGAGIAIGNARADYERDLDAGTASIATRLGLVRSWWVHAAIHLAVVTGAIIAAAVAPGTRPWLPAAVAAAGLVTIVGVGLSRGGSPGRRELAWEVEAAGIGLVGVVWLLGTSSVG